MSCCGGTLCVLGRVEISTSQRHLSGMNNRTDQRRSTGDCSARIQLQGILYKKPFGHSSNKWSRRYFIVRDGYLLYYPESERKDLIKRKSFNIHPKGVIPLGECQISAVREAGQPFAIGIGSSELSEQIRLAAETEFERDKWIDLLQKAGRVTFKNTQLGDAMIHQLEDQSVRMAQEKQDYYNKLQTEAHALSDEREKSEELEKINEALELEREKMEQMSLEIKDEYEKIKIELDATLQSMLSVQEDKNLLSRTLEDQLSSLENLNLEKEKILGLLEEREKKARILSLENVNLSMTTDELQNSLREIEKRTEIMLQEKAEAEERLYENQQKFLQLEEEKQHFSEHAEDLKETIKDLKAQKEMTETELREEIVARMSAEKRLREAGVSLGKLDYAVQHETPNIEEGIKVEMLGNVNTLKDFFESLAAESQVDANKPIVMRNTIHARKTVSRRAKSIWIQKKRSSKSRPKSFSEADNPQGKKSTPVRRSATTVKKDILDDTGHSSTLFHHAVDIADL